MGLINLDSYATPYGVSITNTYISINTNDIDVRKETNDGESKFVFTFSYNIWSSQDARNNDDRFLCANSASYEYDNTDVFDNINIYTLAYNKIKERFPNTQDA